MFGRFGIVLAVSLIVIATLFAISLIGQGGENHRILVDSVTAASDSVREVEPAYVGSDKCRICHLDIYKSWKSTMHARAMESLAPDHVNDSNCVRCHITAARADGTVLENVGCEACHGPGSEYRKMRVMKNRELAIKRGLVVQNEAVCTRCHNEDSPDFKGFDYSTVDMQEVHLIPADTE